MNFLTYPPFLQEGDTVAILSPARTLDKSLLEGPA